MSEDVAENFVDMLSFLDDLEDKSGRAHVLPGKNITLENTGAGCRIHAKDQAAEEPSADYKGPWRVYRAGDTKISMQAYNPPYSNFYNYMLLGSRMRTAPGVNNMEVETDGWLCADITYNNNDIAVDMVYLEGSVPGEMFTQADEHLYLPIAFVKMREADGEGGTKTIERIDQYQRGIIVVPSRIF